MKSLKLACVSLLAAVVLAGCGGQSGTAATTPPPPGPATGAATLSWNAPTTDTNGKALTNLAGYRIYYGTSAGNLTQTINLSGVGMQTYVIDNLSAGTWYFAIRAVASTGAESALSNIASKTIG